MIKRFKVWWIRQKIFNIDYDAQIYVILNLNYLRFQELCIIDYIYIKYRNIDI